MKYYHHIFRSLAVGMLSVLALASCNSWLDVEPSTQTDRSELFSSESGFADAMAGVYTNLCSSNLYGKNLTWYGLELMGSGATCMFGTNASYMSFSFHPKASYYSESLRNSFVDPIWNEGYNTIANVNSLLEGMDGQENVFTDDDYNIFKGEALGLRAFIHFDLLRLFGPAGTVDSTAKCMPYVNALSSKVYPLLTVGQVARECLADLVLAKELLKSDPMVTGASASRYICSAVTGNATYRQRYNIYDWHNRRFHFNYYAVVATMARIYLWMGNKEKALSCAKEVIDAQPQKFPWVNPTLVANVASTSEYVSRDRTFSTEQIFTLNITDLEDRMDGYLIANQNSFSGVNGNIEGVNIDCFDESTRASDPRYTYLLKTYSIYGSAFAVSNKYYKDNDYNNSYSPWSANRLPLIRVSEMYYIAAECEPDLQKAVEYLETVRQNRGMSAYPLQISNRDELQQEIEKEYAKEFIAEGQLFYYHKRLNELIINKTAYDTYNVTPTVYTLPRPDDENTNGGRTE